MQITFDPRDRGSCVSVIAIATALHADLVPTATLAEAIDAPTGAAVPPFVETIRAQIAPNPTAEQAFDAPPAEQAFAPAPFVPLAETATAAPAPAPQAAPAASPSSALDADGVPWDARIHSGPADKRPMNADGRWRRARGVDDATVAVVMAELRGEPAPVPAPPPPAAAPTPAPVAAAPAPAPIAPAPLPEPANTASGADAATTAPLDFAGLMRRITQLQTAGLLTVETTKQIAESLGVTDGLRGLISRPDLVPTFASLLPEAAA